MNRPRRWACDRVVAKASACASSGANAIPGQIVILNGAPRSGKSSIAEAIQASFDGVWMNLGVDAFMAMTPPSARPGIGLRPGEPAHPVAPLVPMLYAAMYDAIAALSRAGLNVVVDVGHHDLTILRDCARRLDGLPVLFVGVRCPIETIMERRHVAQPGREQTYLRGTPDDPIPEPVQRWQDAVHAHWTYDLDVDASQLSADECALIIHARLADGPPGDAFLQLRAES